MENVTGIAEAVSAAGSQTFLAEDLGVSQQAISKWLARGWVPLDRATQIAGRYQINPNRLANPKLVRILEAQFLLLTPVTPSKQGRKAARA